MTERIRSAVRLIIAAAVSIGMAVYGMILPLVLISIALGILGVHE